MKKIPIVAVQPMRDGSVQHARAPVHAQDQRTKAETLARLEQMRAYVDWKLKTTSENTNWNGSSGNANSTA